MWGADPVFGGEGGAGWLALPPAVLKNGRQD